MELEGIEQKTRLIIQPNGFPIDGVICHICGEETKDGTWYAEKELMVYFHIQAQTIDKWLRDGVVKIRTITNLQGGVRRYVFLLRDNEGVLPPRHLVENSQICKKWGKKLKKYKILEYLPNNYQKYSTFCVQNRHYLQTFLPYFCLEVLLCKKMLCGTRESNPYLLLGRQSFYH